jgi:hypothetical protein
MLFEETASEGGRGSLFHLKMVEEAAVERLVKTTVLMVIRRRVCSKVRALR